MGRGGEKEIKKKNVMLTFIKSSMMNEAKGLRV